MLVSIDTLAAGHLPIYGYRRNTMPFLSELASNGVVVERFTAAATDTLNSHMTMMTGLAPSEHGVHGPGQVLDSSVPTLAESLHAAGYRTGAFTEDGGVDGNYGFSRGFDVYLENRSPDVMNPEGHIRSTFDQAADWLGSVGNAPVFLFAHTYQVHGPYTPSEAYRILFRDDLSAPSTQKLPWHKIQAILYDEEVRYADDELRRLWLKIRDLGHEDDTVLIVTSDHGESFLEHGWLGHGSYLYEEQTRVPFVMTGPGIARGARIYGQAGHLDLFPTVAELAGVPSPANLSGISLIPFSRASSPSRFLPHRLVASESWSALAIAGAGFRQPFPGPAFAVIDWPRKLARYHYPDGRVRYDLFNLQFDPGESHNLWPAFAKNGQDLKDIVDHQQDRGEQARRARRGSAVPTGDGAIPGQVDPAVREKLKALGYLE